jgi:hypothetical protein
MAKVATQANVAVETQSGVEDVRPTPKIVTGGNSLRVQVLDACDDAGRKYGEHASSMIVMYVSIVKAAAGGVELNAKELAKRFDDAAAAGGTFVSRSYIDKVASYVGTLVDAAVLPGVDFASYADALLERHASMAKSGNKKPRQADEALVKAAREQIKQEDKPLGADAMDGFLLPFASKDKDKKPDADKIITQFKKAIDAWNELEDDARDENARKLKNMLKAIA